MNGKVKVDGAYIEQLLAEGYLMSSSHPTHSLRILNYTRKAQFEKFWNETTLMCRGLIIDEDYNIVARGFPKFFNYEEHKPEEIPDLPFEVFEKMDGSLGICFKYEGEWIMATRGSFVSEQAIRGRKMLEKYNIEIMDSCETLLFEIIYPENRIVCNYGDEEKLVLLGVINNETGEESPYDNWASFYANWFRLDIVKKYDGVKDIAELKALNTENKEGFVLKFSNGMRIKVKFEDYVRLHSIVTNVSTTTIWEHLRDGKNFNELLERVPDEFDSWVRNQTEEMLHQFSTIFTESLDTYRTIVSSLPENFTKKDLALKVLEHKNSAVLFKIHEGKSAKDIIWKMVKPEWSKPWKVNMEEEI